MGRLFQRIKEFVGRERYLIGQHASERLEERGILEWQVVVGLAGGELLRERPRARPNPGVEVLDLLPDGTECKAVWAYLKRDNVAKLVTVHFFDEEWS